MQFYSLKPKKSAFDVSYPLVAGNLLGFTVGLVAMLGLVYNLISSMISGVALIVVKEGGICNLDVILASLLHDTVEDTEVTLEQICDQFGECIGNIIQEVTDKKSLPKQRRKDLQVLTVECCLTVTYLDYLD